MLRKILVALGIPALGICCFIVLNLGDEPVSDHGDLAADIASLPDSENGYPLLQEAAAQLSWADEDNERIAALFKGEAWDESLARSLIDANQAALAGFAAALERPGFQTPRIETIHDDLPNMLPWLRMEDGLPHYGRSRYDRE